MIGFEESKLLRVFKTGFGLAAPVSLLLILFSLTMVSAVSYNFALKHISYREKELKVIAAEEKMLYIDEMISSVSWSPGTIRSLSISDYGGKFSLEPESNLLELNLTLGEQTYTLFNFSTGRFVYKLPFVMGGKVNKWIRGDERSLVNQNSAYLSQIRTEIGTKYVELIMNFRPLVLSSVGDLEFNRRINNIRVFIINLNESEALESEGEFYIKTSIDNVFSNTYVYNLDSSITDVVISAKINCVKNDVTIPLSFSSSGSTVNVELVIIYIDFQEVRF